MSEAVIVALITGACAVVAQIIIAARSSADLYAKLDKQSELADEKIKAEIAVVKTEMTELTREVRTHNNFAQRVPVLEEQIKVANNRIKDLENKTA